MLGSSWRSFKFFESIGLDDPPLLPPSIEIVSCCLSHAYLLVGDSGGQIHVIDRTAGRSRGAGADRGQATAASSSSGAAGVVASFQAYTGPVTHMKYLRSRNVLATLGDDDSLNPAILRLWHVDRCVELCQGGSTAGVLWRPPSREHRIFTAKYPPPAAAAGAVLVKVNQNEDRLRSLVLRAGGSRRPASPTPASAPPGDGDGIPATSLLTTVVAFDVSEDAQNCAVALTNGECVLLRGDLEKDRAVHTRRIRSSLASGRMAFVGFPAKASAAISTGTHATGSKKATGTLFSSTPADDAGTMQVLFTVYDSMTTVWSISSTGECTELACYEGSRLAAAGPGCACLTPAGHLVVCTAGDGALAILSPQPPAEPKDNKARRGKHGASASSSSSRCYDPTGMTSGTSRTDLAAPALTVIPIADDGVGGGRRCRLLCHAGYVVLLTASATRPEQFQLQCYDTTNHIRGLTRGQERYTDVAFVLSDGAGELLVLTQAPASKTALAYKAVALREVDTLSKLDLLFTKECYGIAKNIADHQGQGVDPTLHRLIEKRYADYLYAKGKYSEAMEQYVAGIGSIEPSYVIRRYMQSQHIELLTGYLEQLHQQRHGYAAHVSHTTLLLNCYTRQKDEDKLLAFVQRDDIRFDAPNAIAVCRQGGYYNAALLIADKYAQVYERASILIHDLHEPSEALDYICTLGVDDAEDILLKAGKQLIAWEPLRTTDAIMKLCVQWSGPARRLPTDVHTQQNMKHAKRADAKDFLHVFVDSPVCLLNFLRGIVSSGVLEAATTAAGDGGDEGHPVSHDDLNNRRAVYATLFELYITEDLPQSIRVLDEPVVAAPETGTGEGRPAQANLQLETDTGEVFPVEPLPRRQEQAMIFLEAYAGRYDDYVLLTLCHQHHFEEGILFLLRKLHLSADLINFYADKMTRAETLEARHEAKVKLLQEVQRLDERQQGGEKSGSTAARKATWMAVLSLLAQSPQSEWQDVAKVLDHVEAHDILTPTVVMEILCAPESKLELRTVRGYCQRALLKQFEKMKSAHEKTAGHLKRIEELKQDIRTLQTSAVVFPCAQCAQCGQALDFPAVHFMCRHSFHQHCLNISAQCNLCGPGHRQLMEETRERIESVRGGDAAGRFFTQLGGTGGSGGLTTGTEAKGFDVVAEYIAKGALGHASFTSGSLAPFALRPEASLFAPDPSAQRATASASNDEKQVYDTNGDVIDAETVEWW